MKIKQGMILAAGLGKRMQPITLKIPKPLIQVGNKNLLDRSIDLLINHGVDEITINVHHLADQIKYFIDKHKYKEKIKIFHEKEVLLDTGGGILNATKSFKGPFVAINPDTLWSNDYSNELRELEDLYFKHKRACLLLVTTSISADLLSVSFSCLLPSTVFDVIAVVVVVVSVLFIVFIIRVHGAFSNILSISHIDSAYISQDTSSTVDRPFKFARLAKYLMIAWD